MRNYLNFKFNHFAVEAFTYCMEILFVFHYSVDDFRVPQCFMYLSNAVTYQKI